MKNEIIEKYILVKCTSPLEVELSEILLMPEINRSKYIIKLIGYGKYQIHILDKNKKKASLKINQIYITNIEYDYINHKIIFIINQEPNVLGHKIIINRNDYDFRNEIIFALKVISELPVTRSILTIEEI